MIDSIDQETVALLINAVYFKGAWQKQFSESATTPGKFRSIRGSMMDCNMMHLDIKTKFASGGDGSKSVKLPYGKAPPGARPPARGVHPANSAIQRALSLLALQARAALSLRSSRYRRRAPIRSPAL